MESGLDRESGREIHVPSLQVIRILQTVIFAVIPQNCMKVQRASVETVSISYDKFIHYLPPSLSSPL